MILSVILWGNATINEMWGYYSFQPKNTAGTISFTQLGSQAQRIARNGVQIADGKLYTVDFERYGPSNGDLTLLYLRYIHVERQRTEI